MDTEHIIVHAQNSILAYDLQYTISVYNMSMYNMSLLYVEYYIPQCHMFNLTIHFWCDEWARSNFSCNIFADLILNKLPNGKIRLTKNLITNAQYAEWKSLKFIL